LYTQREAPRLYSNKYDGHGIFLKKIKTRIAMHCNGPLDQVLLLDHQKSAEWVLVTQYSTRCLIWQVLSINLAWGFLVLAGNMLSVCLGGFGHFGNVQICASAVYDAYSTTSGSYGPLTCILDQLNVIYMVHDAVYPQQ